MFEGAPARYTMVSVPAQLVAQRTPPDLGTGHDAVLFVLTIGEALHRYGTPAHQLEEALTQCAAHLGLTAQFFSTPTSLFCAFGPLHDQQTYLIRVEPGETNLSRLGRLDGILQRVLEGQIEAASATEETRAVVAEQPPYSGGAIVLFTAIVSAATAGFFGGRWAEVGAAGLTGLVVGSIGLLIQRFRRLSRLFELLAGIAAGMVAVLANRFVGPVSTFTILVSGVILLLPGLTLTVAVNELATRHLVAGTARFTGALVVLVSLGFGVAIGLRLESLVPAAAGEAPILPAPHWWAQVLALVIAAAGFTGLFAADARDYGWILLAAGLGFYGGRVGSLLLGPELGACFGAFVVAGAANGYARCLQKPAAKMMLPGVLVLVPGSVGFASFSSLMQSDVSSGVEAAFQVVLVAVSIVAGLLLANVAVAPRRVL